jgi:hypothetical protein
MELLKDIAVIILSGGAIWLSWMSCVMVDEDRKFRRKGMRDGTHDYYGNKIDD